MPGRIVVTDAVDAGLCGFERPCSIGVGASVGQLGAFNVAPHGLDGGWRSGAWKPGRRSTTAPAGSCGADVSLHAAASVRGQPVPDQRDLVVQSVVKRAQELDQALVVVERRGGSGTRCGRRSGRAWQRTPERRPWTAASRRTGGVVPGFAPSAPRRLFTGGVSEIPDSSWKTIHAFRPRAFVMALLTDPWVWSGRVGRVGGRRG